MKKLGIQTGVIVFALTVFWLGWLAPPDVEDVCTRVVAATSGEAGAPTEEAATKMCLQTMKKGKTEGQLGYVRRLRCAKKAESSEELDAC